MVSRVAVDEALVAEAMQIGGFPSGKAAATAALHEFIRIHRNFASSPSARPRLPTLPNPTTQAKRKRKAKRREGLDDLTGMLHSDPDLLSETERGSLPQL
jgi:Bacterial antitoxin of type II TA system, VapB